ncbi:unnamed protein product [Bursaphelenchus okinawaensis]|uniref:Neur_chan_LBD domain-containing protein n=1 Tax=Bursaphelenchus okinawaensis TaxID=465554 RepID=A0A811L323_9BILA|nr:unnamed protein product [Bursaphelenchus okinawaensis]CAG9115173.1 unnamed protein product [Bursaphelenchus okinawaensis]
MLVQVDENQQLCSFVISHTQQWTEPKLSWNPEEYWNITSVSLPPSVVWLPSLFIYNSISTKDMMRPERFNMRLHDNGRVFMNIPQTVVAVCDMDVSLFPFDTQYCPISHTSPLLTVEEQVVTVRQTPEKADFKGNPEYDVINVTTFAYNISENGETRMSYVFVFQLKRRPLYYIIVIVIPTFLISALSIFGIFCSENVAQSRTEKISTGLASLLSLIVLLGVISSEMPRTEKFPLLGMYILSVLFVISLAIVVSFIEHTIHARFIEKNVFPSLNLYKILLLTPCKDVKEKIKSNGKCVQNDSKLAAMIDSTIRKNSTDSLDKSNLEQ